MDHQAIGQRIKAAREKQGWTQEQLAEKLNIGVTHISVIERGVKAPRFDTFISIANALEIDANSLLIDVLDTCPVAECSKLSDQIDKLAPNEQKKALRIISTVIHELEA